MNQLTFDFFNPPPLSNQTKQSEFYEPKYKIRIRLTDKTVIWTDEEGEYASEFATEVEAAKGYEYWCKSALAGGEII